MLGRRDDIRAFLNKRPDSVLIEVTDVKGSAPRDAGAWMLVARDMIFRTIGGGQLEYMAIDHARKSWLAVEIPRWMYLLAPKLANAAVAV